MSLNSGLAARMARATAAALASPDGSPATIRISRTRGNRHVMRHFRLSALDLAHDLEGHRERLSAIFAGDRDGSLAADRIDETLKLQCQRIAFRGFDRLTRNELLQR